MWRGAVVLALCLLLAPVSSQAAPAQVESLARKFYVGAGVLVYGTGSYSNQPTGETAFSALVMPELSVHARLPLRGDLGFVPLASITPLGSKSSDGGLRTIVLRAEGKLTYLFGEVVDLQAGLGIADAIMIGSGGTTVQKNGNEESTFGIPSKTISSYLFYWQVGLGAELIKPVRIDLSTFVIGVLSSSRAFNYTLSLSYGFL